VDWMQCTVLELYAHLLLYNVQLVSHLLCYVAALFVMLKHFGTFRCDIVVDIHLYSII